MITPSPSPSTHMHLSPEAFGRLTVLAVGVIVVLFVFGIASSIAKGKRI